MTGIFISYREEDTKPWAIMLAEHLVRAFGKEQVFLDKDTLQAGSWREQILQALDRSNVVLVIIGRKWLSITDNSGRRRLDDPTDIHRQEIALALARKEVTVIPVIVDRAPLPRPGELPEDIRSLTECQSRELSDHEARRTIDLKQLTEEIDQITGLKPLNRISKGADQTGPGKRASLHRVVLLIITMSVSVFLLVFMDLVLGWTLAMNEKWFVVLLVFLTTFAVSRWLKHIRRDK